MTYVLQLAKREPLGLTQETILALHEEINGRMARCLQTLLLAASGTTTAAPELVSIEEYLGDTRPWLRFSITAQHRQALRVERRAELAGRLWIRVEKEIDRAGLPERCVQPLTYCLSGRYLRNTTYRQPVPEISQKRGRRYVPSRAMLEVAMGLREEVNRRLPATGDPYA